MTLLDTDILIDYLRGFSTSQDFLDSAYQYGHYSISVITAIELIRGVRDKKSQKVAEDLISKFQIVEITTKISTRAFELIKAYHLNQSLALADSFIASTVLEHHAKLLTRNLRDFDFIPKLNVQSPY